MRRDVGLRWIGLTLAVIAGCSSYNTPAPSAAEVYGRLIGRIEVAEGQPRSKCLVVAALCRCARSRQAQRWQRGADLSDRVS
jgi:hypothetical protein